MDWAALQRTWTELPEPVRTRIHEELVASVRARVSELDSFYPQSPSDAPTIDVLGIVEGSLHFIAHESNYMHAQSGSDWATHFVFIGKATIDGDRLGAIRMAAEVSRRLAERSWEDYRPAREVEAVRDQALTALGVTPPAPALVTVTVRRCPSCGATDVAERTCNVCGHADDGPWEAVHERRADDDTPEFVAPAPSTEAGFELRGRLGDAKRLLVHHGVGYAIVLPDAWERGPSGARTAIADLDLRARFVARAAHVKAEGRHELLAAARRRASVVGAIEEAPTPAGGDWCGLTMYERAADARTEMLALTTKGARGIFLYVAFSARALEHIAWLNLRAALLGRHTWQPDELDVLQAIWPDGGAFAEPKLSFGYVRSGDRSEAKAEQLAELSREQARAVNDLLVREAGRFVAPATAWARDDTTRVASALRACAGERFAEILGHDLGEAKTMHDFRRWCTLVKWAVDNKGRRRT